MNRDFRWSGPEKIIDVTKYLMQCPKNEIKVLEISYRCNYIVEKKIWLSIQRREYRR